MSAVNDHPLGIDPNSIQWSLNLDKRGKEVHYAIREGLVATLSREIAGGGMPVVALRIYSSASNKPMITKHFNNIFTASREGEKVLETGTA